MKTQNFLFVTVIFLSTSMGIAQSTKTGVGAAGHTPTNPFPAALSYLGWQDNRIPLYFRTNYLAAPVQSQANRMIILNGGFGQTNGRIAMGNSLPNSFSPLSRLHLHESTSSGTNGIRFTSNATGITPTDGYQIEINNANRVVNHIQYEDRPIRYFIRSPFGTIDEWFRIQYNTPNFYNPAYFTSGYIGFNNPNPDFHLDVITPQLTLNTELFCSFRSSDVLDSRMGMLNASGTSGNIRNSVFGNVGPSQNGPALQTFAAIDNSQDLPAATNPEPVQIFLVGKDYVYLQNPLDPINEITNRNAFGWNNGAQTNMLMNAQGLLKIQNNLSLTTPIAATLEVRDEIGTFSNTNTLIYSNHTNGFNVALAVQNQTPLFDGAIAGYFEASSFYRNTAIAVPSFGGNVGLGDVSPNDGYRLVVVGDELLNGDLDHTGGINFVSDQQFKTNLDSISNAYQIILQLNPKQYYFDTTNAYGMNFSSKKQYGFVAQEVENILPELVSTKYKEEELDSSGNVVSTGTSYKSLNYNAFIAILTKGMQEQQRTIDSLELAVSNLQLANQTYQDSVNNSLMAQMAAMQAQLNQMAQCVDNLPPGLCGGNAGNGNGNGNGNNAIPTFGENVNYSEITLTDMDRVVLDQNVPNPFAEQTIISYYLPADVQRAQMLFYDHTGKLINTVDLNDTGHGQLQVFANDLSNGMYNYVLVVDGEIKDSKQMVKTN